jgi:fatty acid synthase subunit beta
MLEEFLTTRDRGTSVLGREIDALVAKSRTLPLDTELKRGKATIPLAGIDVPFHSRLLRSMIPAVRKSLQQRIKVEELDPESLLGKFIPNVMGKQFSIARGYIDEAAKLTQSHVLRELASRA